MKKKKRLFARLKACRKEIATLALVMGPVVFLCVFSVVEEASGQDTAGGRPRHPPPLLDKEPYLPPRDEVLKNVPPALETPKRHLPGEKIFIKEIKVTGSTVFSNDELAKVTGPFMNRELSPEDLEDARRELTLYYVKNGYINSGAVVPNQEVTDGILTIQIIEGQLTKIEIEEKRRFRPNYIKNRIELDTAPPLNIFSLQRRLQLLQQDPRIEQINAELRPGLRRGESELGVEIKERSPYKFGFKFNNYEPPSVGAEEGEVFFLHENLTGNGDILSLAYGRSNGVSPDFDIFYSVPVTSRDTTATFHFQSCQFTVVEEPFEPLDIESELEVLGLTLRHPFYRNLHQELALVLTGERLINETFLLGEPFSFSPGAENGESRVTALRAAPEWIYRTQSQVFACRSRFSYGLDALGATMNADQEIPDADFFSWLGQFQWAGRFGESGVETSFRLDIQLTNEPLLPIEQIAVGGRYTVRGYRENQMVRDNGLIASVECRIPLVQDRSWADFVQLVPFVDYGRAWNDGTSSSEQDYIASIGIGLRWGVTLTKPFNWQPQFEIYWGHPLKEVPNPRSDLQDNGIHAQIVIVSF